jgi:hypothetical protein
LLIHPATELEVPFDVRLRHDGMSFSMSKGTKATHTFFPLGFVSAPHPVRKSLKSFDTIRLGFARPEALPLN